MTTRQVLPTALAIVLVLAAPARAQGPLGPARSAGELKVAFLINFMKFIEWPAAAFAGSSAPLTLGIIGVDPFEGMVDLAVERQAINGRRVQVKHLSEDDGLRGIQILFIGESRRPHADILRRLDNASVLTIADGDAFLAAGGVIGFIIEHDRLRFDINITAAHRANLSVSSKLLSVARALYKDVEP